MAVVYTQDDGGDPTSLFSRQITLTAGDPIPVGQWFVAGAFTINADGGPLNIAQGGYCVSDGHSVISTAASAAIKLGGSPPE